MVTVSGMSMRSMRGSTTLTVPAYDPAGANPTLSRRIATVTSTRCPLTAAAASIRPPSN
jgi:hypothetical protein